MKARRAQEHLKAFEVELKKWNDLPPYTITHKTDLNRGFDIWGIWGKQTPEPLAMVLGDFVCCLRSALDQLAWGLAHLDTKRVFSEKEQRDIAFPVARVDDPNYRRRLSLFPSTVASAIDSFQPHHRGNAYRDDPLWQLHELWTLDKHRAIPMASNSFNITFPYRDWDRFIKHFQYGLEVHFPLSIVWNSPVEFKPEVSIEVLFGEYGSPFEISFDRIKEINDFVRNAVIPKFAGFFP
jgi:hypothetical protein